MCREIVKLGRLESLGINATLQQTNYRIRIERATYLFSFNPYELCFEELWHVDEEGCQESRGDEDRQMEERRVVRLAHVVLKRVPDNGLHRDFGLELVCGESSMITKWRCVMDA